MKMNIIKKHFDALFCSSVVVKDILDHPAKTNANLIMGKMEFEEEDVAKRLFIEMCHFCTRAYFEFKLKSMTFDKIWFNETFKNHPERVCHIAYSACQPLLSKYSALFEKTMLRFFLKLLNVDNLDMLEISFEPVKNFSTL